MLTRVVAGLQASYQTTELISSVDVETTDPDLLIIRHKELPVNSH